MEQVIPEYYDKLLLDAKKNNFGMIIYIPFSTASLAIEKSINLWLTHIPPNWKETFNMGNNDLATLLSILICKNWEGTIDAHIVNQDDTLTLSMREIEDFKTMVRFPHNTSVDVKQGDLITIAKNYRNADVNIFSVESGMLTTDMIKIVSESRISAIFCLDSQMENVLV